MDSILTDFEFHFLAFWKFLNSLSEKCIKYSKIRILKKYSINTRQMKMAKAGFQMVENQRNSCRFRYLYNAILKPSKVKLVLDGISKWYK